MNCPRCGAMLGEGVSICDHCGIVIDESAIFGGPSYAPGPLPVRRMKTDRSIVVYILLNLVTFGIYGLYTVYSIAQDMNEMCDDDEHTGGLLFFIVISLLTFGIYSLIWEYKIGNRVFRNAPQYGIMVRGDGTTIVLWRIFGLFLWGIGTFVGLHILFRNVNSLAAAYNASYGL